MEKDKHHVSEVGFDSFQQGFICPERVLFMNRKLFFFFFFFTVLFCLGFCDNDH